MKGSKDEKRLLRFAYLFCIICFINLAFIKTPIDRSALIMGGIVLLLLTYSHFIIRRFFSDGDKYLLVFSSVLSTIGIVMLYRLNKTESIKQILWFTISITMFILIVVLLPDLKRFKKLKYLYLVLTLVFMSMATFLGTEVLGAKNWIIYKGISFQPSEFGKLTLIAYLASVLEDYNKNDSERKFSLFNNLLDKLIGRFNINESFKILIEPALVVMVSLGFMVIQRDLGSALILFAISVTMLYLATSKAKYVYVCIGLFLIGSVISYYLFHHVQVRVHIWANPEAYKFGAAYQVWQSQIAIVSGGLFGSGLGLGYPDVYVPVLTTDFIYAAICEEMGVLMGFAILFLYFLLFYRSMRAAVYTEENFSRLLAVGYSTMIASQVLVIIGGVIGAVPLTGITLPFVSYGGSSMIISFCSLGILQKISEEGR